MGNDKGTDCVKGGAIEAPELDPIAAFLAAKKEAGESVNVGVAATSRPAPEKFYFSGTIVYMRPMRPNGTAIDIKNDAGQTKTASIRVELRGGLKVGSKKTFSLQPVGSENTGNTKPRNKVLSVHDFNPSLKLPSGMR